MTLPEKHTKLILTAAECNWDNNAEKFKRLDKKELYMLAYLHGYDACYGIFGPITMEEGKNE